MLLFMDETSMKLHPPLRQCWMKVAQQKRIDTPGQQQQIHYFGAYDWATDRVHGICEKRRNSDAFCQFLAHVMTEIYPTQQVVMVMDNASFHTSQMAQAGLSLYEARLQVVYLPKYCPFLNPIERFWQHLKQLVNVNRLHRHLDDLIACLQFHLQQQNRYEYEQRFTFSKH